MGNGQHCLVGKAFADGLLEQLVCLLVHTCCGLVNAQDLDSMQQGGEATGETVTSLQFPTFSSALRRHCNPPPPPTHPRLSEVSYFSVCKKSSCQTQQLSLSQGQVPAPFTQLSVQATCKQNTCIAGAHSLLLACFSSMPGTHPWQQPPHSGGTVLGLATGPCPRVGPGGPGSLEQSH